MIHCIFSSPCVSVSLDPIFVFVRCANAEHVSEMLAKEADLGSSLLHKKADDADVTCTSLERVVEMLVAAQRNMQESTVLQGHALSKRFAQREFELQEKTLQVP